MKIEVKKTEGNKRELSIEVAEEIVKAKFENVFNRISQEAKIAGFRPGKAPRDILEKHYSAEAENQVLRELVPDIYNQAVDQEKLKVIEMPEIFDVKLDRTSLSFKAKVEVSPEVEVKNYKGIKVHYKKLAVAPDEIRRSLDAIKESRKLETLDDGFAKSLGYPNLAELEIFIEKQLFIQKENQQRAEIENEVIEAIRKDLDFKLPASMVKRQLEDLVRQAKLDLALKGVTREKIEEHEKKLSEQFQAQAERQVRIYLILSAIAKYENIADDDHMSQRVMEFLFKEADWQEKAS